MRRKKYLSRSEAWELATKLAVKLGNIQAVAQKIGAASSTVYKWGAEDGGLPDVRLTLELIDLAKKEGIIKS